MTYTEPGVPTEKPWSLKKLQPLPPVAMQLLRLVSADDCSFARISTLVRTDAAFSAEVLRIANSPLFAVTGKINNVAHAVAMLGVDRLKSIVVAVALRNFLSATLRDTTLRRCWRHSLACACACEELAIAAGMDKDNVYTAGLLHDVGRLGMLASYPEEYARMLDVADKHGFEVLETERDLFDTDHCQAGIWLAREWALPREFEEITGHHHAEPAGGKLGNLAIVQLGCRISDALGFGAVAHSTATIEEINGKLPEVLRQSLGADDEFVVRIGEKTTALERDLLV